MGTTENEEVQIVNSKSDWKKYFNYQVIVKNIPFFLFFFFFAVIYIYIGHYADKLIRKIAVSEKNIKELEYEYKTVKSEVIFRSKASELVKAVEPLGLRELKVPATDISDSIKTNN